MKAWRFLTWIVARGLLSTAYTPEPPEPSAAERARSQCGGPSNDDYFFPRGRFAADSGLDQSLRLGPSLLLKDMHEPWSTFDGATWVLEGRRGTGYHVVRRGGVPEAPIKNLSIKLIESTGMNIPQEMLGWPWAWTFGDRPGP